MRTVYRYPLALGAQSLTIQRDAEPVFVAMRQNDPTMWCICYSDSPLVLRRFVVAETGADVPTFARYVGSYQQGGKAYHAFEVPA